MRGDAEIRGLEVELSSMLTEHWVVSGAVTLLDTQYGDFINLDGMYPERGFQNAKGNPLNKAPRTAINLGVAYSTPVQWGGRLTLRADAAYRSRTYFREFKDKADSQGAYTVVNLNASWESEDRGWEARLYARNATDEEYITFILGSGTDRRAARELGHAAPGGTGSDAPIRCALIGAARAGPDRRATRGARGTFSKTLPSNLSMGNGIDRMVEDPSGQAGLETVWHSGSPRTA